MSYAWEKLHMAMHTLAGLGSIQERLADAVSLHLLHLEPRELPQEVRGVFAEVLDQLAGSDSITQTAAQLTDEQALDAIEKIMVVVDAVARAERPY